FGNQKNSAVVRATFNKANDVRVIKCGSHVDLAHKAAERLIRNRDFGQQSLDSDRMPGLLVARQHHATHSAAPEQPDHFITRNWLGPALKFFAAILANESQLFIGQAFSLIAPTTVSTFNRDNDRASDSRGFRKIQRRSFVRLNFDLQNGLPTLNPIAAAQVGLRHALSVHKSAVRRSQITQEATWRSNFQQTMMTREKLILRQVEMRGIAATDQEGVMLIESKLAAGVRSFQDSENNAHNGGYLLISRSSKATSPTSLV